MLSRHSLVILTKYSLVISMQNEKKVNTTLSEFPHKKKIDLFIFALVLEFIQNKKNIY